MHSAACYTIKLLLWPTKICESICRETFHAAYYFLLFLALVKKILLIFHFTMLAGLLLYQLHWLPVEFGIKLKLTVFSVSRALSSAAAHQPIFIHLHLHVSNFLLSYTFYMLCIDTVHI